MGHDHSHDHHEHSHGHHGHSHGHHGHSHGHHGHSHGGGIWGIINTVFHFHGHSDKQQELASDPALATSEGIRTVWLALAALGVTTIIQIAIVVSSNSTALLADTVHNFGDALNSIPLLIAFYLARRAANRRYTYGYGKAEDVAGIFIVLSLVFSAGYAFYESINKLINPTPLQHLGWVRKMVRAPLGPCDVRGGAANIARIERHTYRMSHPSKCCNIRSGSALIFAS